MSSFPNIFLVFLVNDNMKIREKNLCNIPWCYTHLTQIVLKDGLLMAKLVTVNMLSPKSEWEVLALKLMGEHHLTGSQKVYQPLVQSQILSLKINFLYKFLRV